MATRWIRPQPDESEPTIWRGPRRELNVVLAMHPRAHSRRLAHQRLFGNDSVEVRCGVVKSQVVGREAPLVVGFRNRQCLAGTRRVHQREHAGARADTVDTPQP